MKPRIDALDALGDMLGDDHDLVVLEHILEREPPAGVPDFDIQTTGQLIASLRRDLQIKAFAIAPRLFVETPSAFTDRLGAYWALAVADDVREN